MKSVVAAAISSVFFTSAAMAEHVEWSGSLCITAANQTCSDNGWTKGMCFASRYVEPNVSDSGSATKLSLFARTYAVNFTSQNASIIGTTFQPVTVTKVGSSGYQFTSQIRITTERPNPVVATTPMIRSFGDINDWDDIPGCNISFLAAHTLCPQTYC